MSRRLLICLALAWCGYGLGSAHSQNIPDAIETPVTATVNANGYATAVAATPRRFAYSLNLRMRAVYDDNIFLTPNAQEGDFYFTIEPQITLGFGDIVGNEQNYVRLDYAPGAIFYVDHSSANALQHIINLQGQYHFQRLSITLSQDVELLEGSNLNSLSSTSANPVAPINLDTGGNADQNIYRTNGTFSYDLTGKTSLSGGFQFTINAYEGQLIDSQTVSGNLFLNFTYSPKLTIGLGGTGGYDWGSPNTDQTFEQINARIAYQVTGKVSINASGGVEFRQFGNGNGSNISPVYELDATYQPFDGTSVTLSGSRNIQSSAVNTGQDYSSTNITLGIRQRFLQRLYLSVSLGYENSTYFDTGTGTATSREDNYYFVQPAIDLTITRFWTSGAYYLHRKNDSSVFGFDDNQFGLRTSLVF